MGFFFEMDLDEFIDSMEMETLARRRVNELLERRAKRLARGILDDDFGTTH